MIIVPVMMDQICLCSDFSTYIYQVLPICGLQFSWKVAIHSHQTSCYHSYQAVDSSSSWAVQQQLSWHCHKLCRGATISVNIPSSSLATHTFLAFPISKGDLGIFYLLSLSEFLESQITQRYAIEAKAFIKKIFMLWASTDILPRGPHFPSVFNLYNSKYVFMRS